MGGKPLADAIAFLSSALQELARAHECGQALADGAAESLTVLPSLSESVSGALAAFEGEPARQVNTVDSQGLPLTETITFLSSALQELVKGQRQMALEQEAL